MVILGKNPMKNKYLIVCIDNFDALIKMQNEWNDLWLKTEKNIFLSHSWYVALIESKLQCGKEINYQIWCLYESNVLICIAPLKIVGKKIFFLANFEADYQDFIYTEPNSCLKMLKLLREKYIGFEFLLSDIPEKSNTVFVFLNIFKNTNISVSDICPHKYILPNTNIYLKSKNYRRKKNKIERIGTYRVEHLRDSESICKHLMRMKEFFSQQWRENEESWFFFEEFDDVFMYKITEALSAHNQVLLTVMYLNEESIAYYYGFVQDGKYFYYRSAYSNFYKEFSPGKLALNELFDYCSNNKIDTFDFMRGDYAYKKLYTNQKTKNLSLGAKVNDF